MSFSCSSTKDTSVTWLSSRNRRDRSSRSRFRAVARPHLGVDDILGRQPLSESRKTSERKQRRQIELEKGPDVPIAPYRHRDDASLCAGHLHDLRNRRDVRFTYARSESAIDI